MACFAIDVVRFAKRFPVTFAVGLSRQRIPRADVWYEGLSNRDIIIVTAPRISSVPFFVAVLLIDSNKWLVSRLMLFASQKDFP